MNYFVVKYIGSREKQTVWDALKNSSKQVKSGELFLSNENEVSRLRGIPQSFEIVRKVNFDSLLKEVITDSLKPWSHPFVPATRGKILFLFHSEGGRYIGQKIWEYQIALAFSKMGFGVHILTDMIPPYSGEWSGADKITWERSESSAFKGFDFVVGTSPISIADALDYGNKNRIPCFIIAGEPISSIPGRRESLEQLKSYDKLYKQANKVIVPSLTSMQLMMQCGVEKEKIIVSRPNINPNLLLINLPSKKDEVVLCGREDDHKDIRSTIKDLLISPDKFDVTCIVPNATQLEDEFGIGNRNHNLTFMSNLSEEEKGRVFSKAKILLHPSRWEGFGITVLEALSLGMNVIARPLTAFKEVYGNDILYFKDSKDMLSRISATLRNGASTVTRKYRDIANEDGSIELQSLFEKEKVTLPVNALHVAIIGWSMKFGGGIVARIKQAEALEAAGYKVDMGSWGGTSKFLKRFNPATLNSPNETKHWLKEKRPGIIICDGTLIPQVLPVARELGIPVAAFIHFWTPFFNKTTNLLEEKTANCINTQNAKLLDGVIAVFSNSKYTAKVFKKHLGIDSIVVTPVFDKKRLAVKGRINRSAILTPILEEEPIGLGLYEEILKRLPNREFKVLYWRGGEENRKRLKRTYPNLTILDGVEDVGRHYRSSKIMLYTLQVDHTFGLSFAESLSCRTPVIAAKLGNIPNIVKNGGVLLSSTKVKDWTKVIERCFTDTKYYKKLQAAASKDADKVLQTSQRPLVDIAQKALLRKHKVSLHPGGFLASQHAFDALAKIFDNVKVDAQEFENIIAFGPPEFYKEQISPSTYAYWASTPLQSEIDREFSMFCDTIDLINGGKLGGIISPSPGIVLMARAMGCEKAYQLSVPAPMVQPLKKIKRSKGHLSIFHSGQPRKNTITQLLAILNLDPNLIIHMSNKVFKKLPERFTEALNIVKYSFLEDDKFFPLIASCSAGLQVTIGETFNMTGFQHLALGTPCLISKSCAYWNDLPDKYKHLVIKNPDDYLEISEALDFVLNGKHGKGYHDGLTEWAQWYADKKSDEIKGQFARIFS